MYQGPDDLFFMTPSQSDSSRNSAPPSGDVDSELGVIFLGGPWENNDGAVDVEEFALGRSNCERMSALRIVTSVAAASAARTSPRQNLSTSTAKCGSGLERNRQCS